MAPRLSFVSCVVTRSRTTAASRARKIESSSISFTPIVFEGWSVFIMYARLVSLLAFQFYFFLGGWWRELILLNSFFPISIFSLITFCYHNHLFIYLLLYFSRWNIMLWEVINNKYFSWLFRNTHLLICVLIYSHVHLYLFIYHLSVLWKDFILGERCSRNLLSIAIYLYFSVLQRWLRCKELIE